jgi:RNA polymerase sigma factor (TIGR02999 family)
MTDHSPATAPSDVTRLLSAWDTLDNPAGELLPLVYDQLRAIAQNRMRQERPDHTLQATALVHEAYMKIMAQPDGGVVFQNRARFFAAAAEAMRRILVDHARARKAEKRGSGARVARLDEPDRLEAGASSEWPDPDQLLSLNDAIDTLGREDEHAAQVVRLRFFAGLSNEEVADVLKTSERTVRREWTYARARLNELLRDKV